MTQGPFLSPTLYFMLFEIVQRFVSEREFRGVNDSQRPSSENIVALRRPVNFILISNYMNVLAYVQLYECTGIESEGIREGHPRRTNSAKGEE